MASVYGNAAITICAGAAANCQSGIFKSANNRRGIEVRLPANSPPNGFEFDLYLRKAPPPSDQDFHIGYRAWVLQESLLSPRAIIYAADPVYWSCRAGQKSEIGQNFLTKLHGIFEIGSSQKSLLFPTTGADYGDDKLTRPLALTRIENLPFKPKDYSDYASQHQELLRNWYEIVKSYGPCNITKAEDRLPAIAGIAKRISALTRYSYLPRLWLEDIVRGLCWESHNGPPQTSSKYVGPTRSWVCVTYYPYEKHKYLETLGSLDFEVAEDIKIEDIKIKYATADKFMQVQEGSSLRITGLCCGGGCTVEQQFDTYGNDCGWDFYMSGKLRFPSWNTDLDVGGSPTDRKLMFLRLGQTRDIQIYFPAEFYLLTLEMSPVKSEKYVRVGLVRVPVGNWEQLALENWSVQSVTIT